MAKDVMKMKSAKTLQGGSLTIDTSDGVKVDGAKVIQADIEVSKTVFAPMYESFARGEDGTNSAMLSNK